MALESVGRLQLHDPPQALRLHEGTPKDLWDCALEVNKRAGGVPSFYSDKVIIETMEKRGIPLEDARNYCVVGCVEPGICGCDWTASGGTGVNSYMNFANIFLLAVNDGKNPQPYPDGSPRTQQFGPHTGYLYEMTDIEQVKEAFRAQMDYWIKWYVNMVNLFEDVIRDYLPQPVVSAMMGGCMEKGRDVLDGGAKYNSVGQSGIGLGNATDCLFMVDELCFKTKRCTTRELYDAVMANWEGYEELHDFIDGYEKHYGNGISEVDRYCTYVGDLYPELLSKHTGPRGCHYAAGMFPVTMNVVYGNLTYATPDGRRNGEPLSDGISAVQGHDLNGPTAILNSVTAFDHTNYSNGTLLNMKFHPLVLSGEDGFMKLEQLMSTYFFRMGGMEMQFNIVSSDTLRDAQEHPEDYKDLVVRIAGFSAYFVDVYRKAQDDLIRRSELSV